MIAVLTWRNEAATRQCLESLRNAAEFPDRIVVVDNGSGTGEGVRLAAEFGVAEVTLPENGGVPAGYNAGLTWARQQGASHVLLSNNDLEFVNPQLVSRLAGAAGAGIAAVGPLVRNGDGSVWNAGGRMRRWLGHASRTSIPWAASPYEVDWLDGSCVLVSIEAVCRVGGLEPEFFLYWEEADWCERARAAGFRLLVDPGTAVVHAGWGSGTARQTRRYALRNSLLFLRRNVRGLPAITSAALWLFGRLPAFLLRRAVRERAGLRGPLADAGWAIGWHARDIARRGWRRTAGGPDLCS